MQSEESICFRWAMSKLNITDIRERDIYRVEYDKKNFKIYYYKQVREQSK